MNCLCSGGTRPDPSCDGCDGLTTRDSAYSKSSWYDRQIQKGNIPDPETMEYHKFGLTGIEKSKRSKVETTKSKPKESSMNEIKNGYDNVYGTWRVTTEGDVEGRSVKELGTYTGYVDEIALHLSDRVYYSLTFTRSEDVGEYVQKNDSVSVQFDIESGTWPICNSGNLDKIREIFSERDVEIVDSNYYASFTIKSNKKSDEERKERYELYQELKKEFE